MRLINTLTLELEEFMGAAPPYAILSHTWADGEVTLQDWQRVRQSDRWRASTTGLVSNGATMKNSVASLHRQQQLPIYYTPPTDHSIVEDALGAFNAVEPRTGYWKILKACFQARADALGYLWVDTNCIDKTSSAELSEAINSMYAWYRDAALCYVYLVDVPLSQGPDTLWAPGSRFRTSRWFTRGWTLQELIAPPEAVFFSGAWTRLGTKTSLSGLLADITRVGENYLLKLEGIDGASIAQRMSWASNRTTTRPEDIAYCLLGLFSVHMPLIYGEGAKAFVRLQEEIMKTSDDHSIFAWTWIPQLTDPLMRGKKQHTIVGGATAPPLSSTHRRQSSGAGGGDDDDDDYDDDGSPRFPHARLRSLRENGTWSNPERPMMLAPDPLAFYDSGHLPALAPFLDVSPFAITNAGLSISLHLLWQGLGGSVTYPNQELLFAVLHDEVDRKRAEQVLVCVPLARHGRLTHRYTRTCFPRGPVTIRRRRQRQWRHGDDDNEAAVLASSDLIPLVEYGSPNHIQVARDAQRVPFYYGGFGGTQHELGFWFFYVRGTPASAIDGGFVSHNGVFNSYGIFFDRPTAAAAGETVGGVVVLRDYRKEVAVYLAHRPGGDGRPRRRVRVLVRDEVAPSSTAAAAAASERSEDDISIMADTWTGGRFGENRHERLFEALRRDDEQAAAGPGGGHSELDEITEASAGSFQVILHNQAALSNAPRSRITIAEIRHNRDGPDRDWEPSAPRRRMGLFRGVRTF